MKIDKLKVKSFLNKENHYHRRPYHLRSIILNFDNMSIDNSIVYNYSHDRCLTFEKRHTEYFIEVSYLTIDKNFVESKILKNYLIGVIKNQILLNEEKHCDLSSLKREIKVEKLYKKINKLNFC